MEKIDILFADANVYSVRKIPLPNSHSQPSARLPKILWALLRPSFDECDDYNYSNEDASNEGTYKKWMGGTLTVNVKYGNECEKCK